ncbi:Tubulin-specific chaperone D, partial [Fasciolopsis buskii]
VFHHTPCRVFAPQVLCSTEALSTYLLARESDHEFISEFVSIVERISSQFSSEERIITPLFKFVDFLLNDPAITGSLDGESFGGMLQFDGPVRKRAASLMMILLGHKYPVVRKATATKLYECLVTFDLVQQELMDRITALLTETIW